MNAFGRSVLWAALVLLGLTVGCENNHTEGPGGITVMTQNVYHGFDAAPLMSAQDPNDIPVLAAQAFGEILANDFPERAEAMADKIALEKPHLIGLQEVSLIRTQSPGDAVVGGVLPAETVVFDYLDILLSALETRGLQYEVAGIIQNLDVELPMIVGTSPLAFDDIRLTDFDVILARSDVAVSNVQATNYQDKAFIPTLGLEIPRGYVAVDADLGEHGIFRFVNTHLEDLPFEGIQLMQARELTATLASEPNPVILVGDFNSPAPAGGTYTFLGSQGYVDSWSRNPLANEGEGLTWGHDANLRNVTVPFTMRLDLVLVRAAANGYQPLDQGAVLAEVWGDEPGEQTSSGLWPSDHAGVITRLFESVAWTR